LDRLKRGDLVTIALAGDQGKPQPAPVVQADRFGELASATVLPITSILVETPLLRVTVEPDSQNGLIKRSQIMVDKPQTPSRARVGAVIGRIDDATMLTVNRLLAVFLGLA
jgi:mRNA interferase MazF